MVDTIHILPITVGGVHRTHTKHEGFAVKKRGKWKLTKTGHREAQDVIVREAA